VEPKTYVAGSAKDPKAGSGSLVYAVTAGVIGAAAIAAGVSLTAQESRALLFFFSFFFSEGGTANPYPFFPRSSSHSHAYHPYIPYPFTEKTGGEITPLSVYVAKFGGAAGGGAAAPALVD
jgi:hypothetical protein